MVKGKIYKSSVRPKSSGGASSHGEKRRESAAETRAERRATAYFSGSDLSSSDDDAPAAQPVTKQQRAPHFADSDSDDDGNGDVQRVNAMEEGSDASEESSGESEDERAAAEERKRIKKELSSIPYSVLRQIRADIHAKDSMGHAGGMKDGEGDTSDDEAEDEDDEDGADAPAKRKRTNKHAPAIMSTKRPVSRLRQVVPIAKKHVVDPRFHEMHGKLDEDQFEKAYSFLAEREKGELEQLKRQLRKSTDPKQRRSLQRRISQMETSLRNREKGARKKRVLREAKRQERELVEKGKRPFHLKKSHERELELVARYNELKKAGRLESFVKKRRQKIAAKDRRYLPSA